MKIHFSKIHWRSPIEEIQTGAFSPDGRIPVDCISGVKSAFGVHLEKKKLSAHHPWARPKNHHWSAHIGLLLLKGTPGPGLLFLFLPEYF